MPELDQTEKFPDMAVLQAVTLDRHFPPIDRFLAGEPVNYYYFGFLFFSPLLQLLHIPLEWGFNVSLILLFSMLAAGAYALARELGGNRVAAFLSGLVLTFGSNWKWIHQVIQKGKPFSWWDSSRVIPGTINEFPFFSYLLGDLHAHYIEIPWLTLSFFLLCSLRWECQQARPDRMRRFILALLCSVGIGVHYPLNPWAVPFLSLLSLLLLGKWPLVLFLVGVGSYLVFLPYWIHYVPPVSSIAWVGWGNQSSPIHFFLHWAPFFVPLLLASPHLFRERFQPLKWSVETRLLALSLLLIASCEVIYLRDSFAGGEFFRMNTVFKFYFISWWGLAISVPLLLSKTMKSKFLVGVVAASLVYPILGTRSRLGGKIPTPTLDGMAYWSQALPGEREAVQWLRSHTDPSDVIWEAAGPPYGHYGRFAAFSGRPTILSWSNHQWQWRRNGHQETEKRELAMKLAYSTPTLAALSEVTRRYHVRWIVIGSLEQKDYPRPFLDLLTQLSVAYRSETTTIYRAPLPTAERDTMNKSE